MSTIEDFQRIWCLGPRSVQDPLEVQKCFYEMGHAGCFGRDEGVHTHLSEAKNNANDCLKSFSLSQCTPLLDDSPLASTTVLGNVYEILDSEPLHNLYLGISKLLIERTFKFLGSG